MSEIEVSFKSGELVLRGRLAHPHDLGGGEKRAAFVILHGFGSHMDAANVRNPAALLNKLGYSTLRFDMRGCGISDGERGRLLCLDQVGDTRSAIDFLSSKAEVDKSRICLLGSSFGAAVAVYTAAVDSRVAATVSVSGWGNGQRKFREQHKGPGEWARFLEMLERGRRHKAETGNSLMASRYEIVPIPDHLRGHVVNNSIQSFPVETAQSMFDFSAEDIVGNISPRSLLLLHSSSDSVTPVEQSISLFNKAGPSTELHIFAETDHFMLAEENVRVRSVLIDWLNVNLPALPEAAGNFAGL